MNMYTVKELSLALQKHEETIKRWLRSESSKRISQ